MSRSNTACFSPQTQASFLAYNISMSKQTWIIILIFAAFIPVAISATIHKSVPFQITSHSNSFHHFLPDHRITQNKFFLPNALAQADSQWYLKIASDGYPRSPVLTTLADKKSMDYPSYAFFPLYPMLIRLVNQVVGDVEISAFILMIILLVSNTILLSKYFGPKTTLLILIFPFSIFFRSYYTESLQILLLTLFIVSLVKKRLVAASLFVGLLTITKGTTLLLLPFTWYKLISSTDSLKSKFTGFILSILPITLWSTYCYLQTGDFFIFLGVRSLWFEANLLTPLYNLGSLLNTRFLESHFPHYSFIENTFFLFFSVVLLKAKKLLTSDMFLIGLCLFILPIFTTDLTSFSRYQSINIPLFLFLSKIRHQNYVLVALTFFLSLVFITPFFINWYWVG